MLTCRVVVRNWEFHHPGSPGGPPRLGNGASPLGFLKRRSSRVVADLPVSPVSPSASADIKAGGHHPQPESAFQEPDSNSILESFGF